MNTNRTSEYTKDGCRYRATLERGMWTVLVRKGNRVGRGWAKRLKDAEHAALLDMEGEQ